MNEWSPGDNYPRPGTPNQTGISIRSQKEEREKNIKPLIINIRAVSENKVKSLQKHSLEDVSKSSLSTACKHKKNGNGGSDPRFKRVVSNALQNDACIGTDAVTSNKISFSHSENNGLKIQNTFNGTTNFEKSKNFFKNIEEDKTSSISPKKVPSNELFKKNEGLMKLESENFEQTEQALVTIDKLMINQDVLKKSFSKESFSNCTINSVSTSLASDDLLDDLPNDLSLLSSTTRINKVQNWIQGQKSKLARKQSLITVIGQTQNHDSLSLALHEINKRKKLVKELDKYAMCQNIVETDKEKGVLESVEKITPLLPQRNEIKENKYKNSVPAKNLNKVLSIGNENSKGNAIRMLEENNDKFGCLNCAGSYDFIDPSSQKRFPLKRKSKKNCLSHEFSVKGKIPFLLLHVKYQWVFFIVFLTSGMLCWIIFSLFHESFSNSFDFFVKKPKAMTWYEKICVWLWELFRPSSNYKRNSPWNSY